jgi:ABC-type multidrug transport system fused ATPase/permease subunit
MLELDSGSIVIDGVDISTLPHDYLRTRIVASPQEPYIIESTVRYNVDPSKTVPDAEIQVVLERVQLWKKIESIGGLDAAISPELLSPGEAQLLVLARAMLRKSKVLLLDEPSGR